MNEDHPSDNCAIYSTLDLARFVVGGLSRRRQERLRQHLQSCARCQQRVQELTSVQAVLQRSPGVPLPKSFVLSAHDVRPRRTLWYPVLRSATTAAAMLVLLLFLGGLLQPGLFGLSRPAPRAVETKPTPLFAPTPLPVAVEPVSTWRPRPTFAVAVQSTPAAPTAGIAAVVPEEPYPQATDSSPRIYATVSRQAPSPARVESAPPSPLWPAIHLGGLALLGVLAGLTWLAYRRERPFFS
jgi:anti-sigma factor RsiW